MSPVGELCRAIDTIADLYSFIGTARSNKLAIGRPCHRVDLCGMPTIGENGIADIKTFRLYSRPDTQGGIPGARSDACVVRRPGNAKHTSGMPAIEHSHIAGSDVPDLNGMI